MSCFSRGRSFPDSWLINPLREDNACADSGADLCGNFGNFGATECSNIYPSILSCSDSASPSCIHYSVGDLWTLSSYGCGASGGTVLVLATTTTAGQVLSTSNCEWRFDFPALDTHGSVQTPSESLPSPPSRSPRRTTHCRHVHGVKD
jgi:hypothetical protein